MRHRVLALALLATGPGVAHGEELKNWFGDPYFQVRAGMAACPAPRGPFTTADEMRRSAHARAERGTRCWQEGRCTKPNSYLYDAGIAGNVRQRFADSRQLRASSLWVTIQRRIVWVEGCADANAPKRIEQLLRGVPDVEQLIVNVSRDPAGPPAYPTIDGSAGRR